MKSALVLGVTGGIGSEVARRLLASGWQVRALTRSTSGMAPPKGCERITGDAMAAGDVLRASDGVALIIHAVNPAGYKDWDKLVLPMLDNTIAAAKANGARVVLPGTVNNFGPDALPVLTEASPQHPRTRKGKIRVEMERRLQKAAETGDIKALIVRAGDFFGPPAGNNWFSQGVVKPGARPKSISNPGRAGVGHQCAYLPDLAATMVGLVESDGLPDFATFHMRGHWDEDGTRMMDAIRRVLGSLSVRVSPLPWWTFRFMAPFSTTLREMLEMRYLWEQPVDMGNDRLRAQLGDEPHTPLDQAVFRTLADMGFLEK